MKNLSLLFVTFTLLFVSCDGDAILSENATLQVNYKATFNNQDFALNQDYSFEGGTINFTIFKYYVSNFSLDAEEVAEVELVDFANGQPSFTYEMSTGNYETINMGIGVDAIDNASDPSVYLAEHPLSFAQNNYWAMANSYVFVKLEGQFVDANGVQTPVAYHVGADDYYREFSSNENVTLLGGQTKNLTIEMNLNDLLSNISLPTDNETHTFNNPTLATTLADDFSNAISVE